MFADDGHRVSHVAGPSWRIDRPEVGEITERE
jgi:hypothetical protein